MGRRVVVPDLIIALVEVALVASAMVSLYALDPRGLFPGGVILVGPVLGALVHGIFFSTHLLRTIEGAHGEDKAREWVIRFPQRTLINRTVAVVCLAAAIAPLLALVTGMSLRVGMAVVGVIFGTTFGGNVVRAFLFRRAVAARAGELYRHQPQAYLARTLRERLFVAANLLGLVGAIAAWGYLSLITGIPISQVAAIMVYLPALVGVLIFAWAVDVFRRTRPVLAYLAPRPGATPSARAALRSVASLPFGLGATFFATWAIAASIYGLDYLVRGNLVADAAQIFAALVAIALGMVLYQISIHRRILEPVRDLAARDLAHAGEMTGPSRLSLRFKLAAAFLACIVFGGTFAFLTAWAEHERFLASAAAVDAAAQRDALRDGHAAEIDAAAERGLDAAEAALGNLPLGPGEPFLAVDGRAFLLRPERFARRSRLRLTPPIGSLYGATPAATAVIGFSPAVVAQMAARPDGTAPVPELRASMAWRRLTDRVAFGVLASWRNVDRGVFGLSSLVFVFGMLAAATLGVVFLAVSELTKPVRQLARDAKRIGRGELSEPVPPPDTDELGELASALETARRDLRSKLDSIAELNASLEQKVRDRTLKLEEANASLAKALSSLAEAQDAVVQAEKMASLGRLVAGIAHEINNPLNFVQNSQGPLKAVLSDLKAVFDAARLPPAPSPEQLRDAATALTDAAKRVKIDERLEELAQMLRVMDNGISRMVRVVRALLDFSRQGAVGVAEQVDLEQAIDLAVALLRHDLQDRVKVVRRLGGSRTLWAEPGPFGQVLVNLLKNAVQAIEGAGEIAIESEPVGGGVVVCIRDTGKGMPPEVVDKIFEPFFTTKPQGLGTGLGLAIVHGIVEKHGGRVDVRSEAGKGTEFRLYFPDKPGAA